MEIHFSMKINSMNSMRGIRMSKATFIPNSHNGLPVMRTVISGWC